MFLKIELHVLTNYVLTKKKKCSCSQCLHSFHCANIETEIEIAKISIHIKASMCKNFFDTYRPYGQVITGYCYHNLYYSLLNDDVQILGHTHSLYQCYSESSKGTHPLHFIKLVAWYWMFPFHTIAPCSSCSFRSKRCTC